MPNDYPLSLHWFLAFGAYELRWLKEVQLATTEQLELCHQNRLYQIGQFLQQTKSQTGKMIERVQGHLEHAIRLATKNPGMLFKMMRGVPGVALLDFFLRIKMRRLGRHRIIDTKGWEVGAPKRDGIYWMAIEGPIKEDQTLTLVMVEHRTNSVIISDRRNLYLNSPVVENARFWRVESV